MVGVGGEGEAGRPPGALADPARAHRLQSRRRPADRGADEAAAALGGREMIADDFLDPGDAVAESLEIPFGCAGQDLHERAAADFARRVGRKTRQSRERLAFRRAMGAFDARVQDQKDAPVAGKVHMRHDRRGRGHRPSAGVDGQAAALEQRDAHARARPTIEQARILARVERQMRKLAERRRDGERELSPGAKSGVRGNCARDGELFAGVEAKAFGDAVRETRAPLAFLAQNFKALAPREAERGSRTRRWRGRSIRTAGRDPR